MQKAAKTSQKQPLEESGICESFYLYATTKRIQKRQCKVSEIVEHANKQNTDRQGLYIYVYTYEYICIYSIPS